MTKARSLSQKPCRTKNDYQAQLNYIHDLSLLPARQHPGQTGA